jgi:hypothetical protein
LSRTRVLLFRPQLKVEWYERKKELGTHATNQETRRNDFSFFSIIIRFNSVFIFA